MNRVDTPTAVISVPAQDAPGTPGFFTKGNPAIGLAATVPGQDWFNEVQEELLAIILAAGLTPNKADTDQVLEAINILSQSARYAADSGSANAYVATYTPAITTHVVGLQLEFQAAHANSGASTFNPGPGVKNIKRQNGDALQAGDIPLNGIITVVYDGTNYQLISNRILTYYYAADTGSANAYAVAFSPALSAHVVGLPFTFMASHANTGASTLAINSLSPVALKRKDGSALLADDIPGGGMMIVAYDGTNYQVLNVANPNGACLLAANGYQWVGKKLEQWGHYDTAVTSSQDIAITFPIPFPTAVFGILTTAKGNTGDGWDFVFHVYQDNISLNGFTVRADSVGTSHSMHGFYWRAIGY